MIDEFGNNEAETVLKIAEGMREQYTAVVSNKDNRVSYPVCQFTNSPKVELVKFCSGVT